MKNSGDESIGDDFWVISPIFFFQVNKYIGFVAWILLSCFCLIPSYGILILCTSIVNNAMFIILYIRNLKRLFYSYILLKVFERILKIYSSMKYF